MDKKLVTLVLEVDAESSVVVVRACSEKICEKEEPCAAVAVPCEGPAAEAAPCAKEPCAEEPCAATQEEAPCAAEAAPCGEPAAEAAPCGEHPKTCGEGEPAAV